MKNKLHFQMFLAVMLLMASLLNAQISISSNFSISPAEFKADTLETSQVNVYYNLDFVENTKNLAKKKNAVALLQIGKEFSKFSDVNNIKRDSLDRVFSVFDKIGAKEVNLLINNKPNWNIEVLKNKAKLQNTIYDKAYSKYQYEEAQPKMNWKIGKSEKNLLGYRCREATTQYRGRTYTAYFAEDLPFSDGPHLFTGLPGLILEIFDHKEHFHFTAVALDKKPLPIFLRAMENKYKTTREKFRKLQLSFHQNPSFFLNGGVYNADGTPMEMKSQERPYNPIELE